MPELSQREVFTVLDGPPVSVLYEQPLVHKRAEGMSQDSSRRHRVRPAALGLGEGHATVWPDWRRLRRNDFLPQRHNFNVSSRK